MRLIWVVGFLGVVAAAKSAQASGRGCAVEGRPADPFVVDVVPKGPAAPTLHLRVTEGPVTVHPDLFEAPSHVEVRGVLTFEGTAVAPPYRIKRAVDLNGILDLPVGMTNLVVHRTLRSKFLEAKLTIGEVELSELLVPCDALGIAATRPLETIAPEEEPGERVTLADRVLHLQPRAGSGEKVTFTLKGAPGSFDLHVIESEKNFRRVSFHWLDGAVLTGWVDAAELRPALPLTGGRIELTPPAAPPSCKPVTVATSQPRSRVVVATVAPGTQVYAGRYVGPWAKVRVGEHMTIRYRQKDDWVELVGVNGIASESDCPGDTVLSDAWVHRSAVKLPASEASVVWPEREAE